MNVTQEVIDRAIKVSRNWNNASVQERSKMSEDFDSALEGLSDKQVQQLGKIVAGKI